MTEHSPIYELARGLASDDDFRVRFTGDPDETLARFGLDGLPPDLVGEALSLVADALPPSIAGPLSPYVARYSPFADQSDRPGGDDPLAGFRHLAESPIVDLDDPPPFGFDDGQPPLGAGLIAVGLTSDAGFDVLLKEVDDLDDLESFGTDARHVQSIRGDDPADLKDPTAHDADLDAHHDTPKPDASDYLTHDDDLNVDDDPTHGDDDVAFGDDVRGEVPGDVPADTGVRHIESPDHEAFDTLEEVDLGVDRMGDDLSGLGHLGDGLSGVDDLGLPDDGSALGHIGLDVDGADPADELDDLDDFDL